MKKLLMSLMIVASIIFATSCEKDNVNDSTKTEVLATTNGFEVEIISELVRPEVVQVFTPGEYTTATWLFDVSPFMRVKRGNGIAYIATITGLKSNTTYWLRVWDSNSTYKSLGGFTTAGGL